MSYNKKQTSPSVASLAGRTLQNPSASGIKKQMAAGALSQRSPSKQTGSRMEDTASRVLSSSKYSKETKTFAASILSQSNKER
ncbi:MAG: hypothetical protein PUC15_03385 [Lentisphaeria bacterium]|nr:hypothetical protein [Lentisphaeria bacterium]